MRYDEYVVGDDDMLNNGDMKKIVVNKSLTILLSRINDTYYAIGGCCTHYDAPLSEGLLVGDHVVCPWHHAVFNAVSGLSEEPPALEDVPHYEVYVEDSMVKIKIPKRKDESLTKRPNKFDTGQDARTFIIIGAGAAGDSAAATLRHNGFPGKIIMITKEDSIPYDRTSLNKGFLRGISDEGSLPLRSRDFYAQHSIGLMEKNEVTGIDKESRLVLLDNGESYAYDRLLIATGGRPNNLDVPGSGLDNIFTMRTLADAKKIRNASGERKNVVVVGASFIGLECAFSLTESGCSVTVVAPEDVPFAPLFGEEIGTLFKTLHEDRKVTFKLGATVDAFNGDKQVRKAVLSNGEEIPADMVIIGIGITPNTDFLENFTHSDDGGIPADHYLCADDNIYAAGDIVQFPYWKTGKPVRIEHWRTAQQLGICAAQNMLGKEIPFHGVPFFWSSQLGLHFRYVGYAGTWDDIRVAGDIPSRDFVAYYLENGSIEAAAGINRDKEILAAGELLQKGEIPDIRRLENKSYDICSFL